MEDGELLNVKYQLCLDAEFKWIKHTGRDPDTGEYQYIEKPWKEPDAPKLRLKPQDKQSMNQKWCFEKNCL